MDVGPRPCWFDPGNSGKGFPAMSFSEPLAASIENTSTWLSTLSRAYRKLSGPSTASAVARPLVTDVPMGVTAPEQASIVEQSTLVSFAMCGNLPEADVTADKAPFGAGNVLPEQAGNACVLTSLENPD